MVARKGNVEDRCLFLRYLIETSEVDARMVHHERAYLLGDKAGLLDEYGFLRDPQWVQGLKTLSDVVTERGTIVIAESGLGKSYIAREFAKNKGDVSALFIDVQEYRGDPQSLVAAIKGACDKQYVCLDGLDEAPELASAIVRGFSSLSSSVKRMIFSRGIPELRRFAEDNAMQMYSLLPLTQEDVKSLAQEVGVDGTSFVNEVVIKNLGPICARPLGCVALLEMYKSESGLRGSDDELREHMIRSLCAENAMNSHRYSSSATVSAEACFSYAKKIALILKLSGLSVIKRIDEMGSAPGAVDFTLYEDLFDKSKFNRILLRGLFLPIGEDRFRFAHITYFDYLSALGLMEYVAQKNWREIVMNREGLVYPQWENAVAWMAIKDDEIYNAVFRHQPELLLNSDTAVKKKGQRELCRAVLLRAAQMDYWSRQSSGIVLQFSKLVSPDTVDVLRGFLWTKEENCREMAIDIIKYCGIQDLVPELVKLFCAQTVPLSVRKSAGYALRWIKPPAAMVQDCKVVLRQQRCPQDLKGLVFKLLWPYELSAKEMTPHLTLKEDAVGDSYSMWVSDECPKRFSAMSYEDALEMVRWSAKDAEDDDDSIHTLKELKRKVFTYCFKKFETDEMYDALACVYEVFCEKYNSPICLKPDYEEYADWMCTEDEFNGLVDQRRRLAESVIRREYKNAALWLTGWICDLLGQSDVDFVGEKIDAERDANVRLRWVECADRLQRYIKLPEQAEYWDYLHERFPDVFKCTARRALAGRKKSEQKYAKYRLKMQARRILQEQKQKGSYVTNLQKIRDSIRKGNLWESFYCFANYCSRQRLESKHNEWGFHISCSCVWEDLSADEKDDVVLAAEDFLFNAKAPPRKAGNEIYIAPFASFVLLQEVSPQKLRKLPKEVWHEFRVEIMQGGSLGESESAQGVLQCYCELFKNDFVDSLVAYLRCQRVEGAHFHLGQFKRVLLQGERELCLMLLWRLDSEEVNDTQRFELLDEFWNLSESVTLEHLQKQDLYRRLDLVRRPLLSVFSLYTYPERFAELLTKLDECDAFAREWIVLVVGKESYWHSSLGRLLKMLPTEDLAKFYIMIRKHFPLREEPVHTGIFSPDVIDCIYTFASQLISRIYERKEPELVPILEMMVRALPDEKFLRDHLIRARKDMLAWRCPTYDVKNIHQLLDEKKSALLVHTPEALCCIVVSALEKYNLILSGKKSHRAKLLWNVQKRPQRMTHKDEEDFSDDMRDFLDGALRGLVLNREVQLNRGRHGEPGARTDLWIEAVDNNSKDTLSLCVEVKGSWNRSAKNAIEKQLIRKYMGDGGADAGILVLGWFDAPAPNKVKQNQWTSMESAKSDLDSQMAGARAGGNIVSSVVLDCRW